nr:helix-turn-helix domain-containing protein [Nitrosomonas sp.]
MLLSDLHPAHQRGQRLVARARRQVDHPFRLDERCARVADFDAILEQVERELIERALALAGGNKSKAAQLLSLPRARLLRRLEQLQIGPQREVRETEELPDFRPLSEFPELAAGVEPASPPLAPKQKGEAP